VAKHAPDPAERHWIAGAKAGNQQDFARLIQAYQTAVYNLCYRMLGQREDAEDATQETFLRAYMHLHRYDANRRFLNWILTIASNLCIDRLRKRRITWLDLDDIPFYESTPSHLPRPEKVTMQQQERLDIQAWLNKLPPDYRVPLILLYWYDFSYAEIADTMQLSIPAVKSRLHRARKKLAALMLQQQEVAGLNPSSPVQKVMA